MSLVAESGGQVIGHIGFSPVVLSDGTPAWYGLGPVSVLPPFQRQGVGRALIQEGLARLKALGAQGCCLVGHPGYYQQFGFRNTQELVLEGVPPEVFFALHGDVPRRLLRGWFRDPGERWNGQGRARALKPDRRLPVQSWFRSLPLVASLVAAALLGACAGTATTQVTLTPPDQAPVCQPQAALKASVFWRIQWRADQKDVPEREAAAAPGVWCRPGRHAPAPASPAG